MFIKAVPYISGQRGVRLEWKHSGFISSHDLFLKPVRQCFLMFNSLNLQHVKIQNSTTPADKDGQQLHLTVNEALKDASLRAGTNTRGHLTQTSLTPVKLIQTNTQLHKQAQCKYQR